MKQRLKDLKDLLVILLLSSVGRGGILWILGTVLFALFLFIWDMFSAGIMGIRYPWQLALLYTVGFVGIFILILRILWRKKKGKYALLTLVFFVLGVVSFQRDSSLLRINYGRGYSWQKVLLLSAVCAVPVWLFAWLDEREERRRNKEQNQSKTEGTARMWARGGKSSPRGNFSPRRNVYTEKNKKPRK